MRTELAIALPRKATPEEIKELTDAIVQLVNELHLKHGGNGYKMDNVVLHNRS